MNSNLINFMFIFETFFGLFFKAFDFLIIPLKNIFSKIFFREKYALKLLNQFSTKEQLVIQFFLFRERIFSFALLLCCFVVSLRSKCEL